CKVLFISDRAPSIGAAMSPFDLLFIAAFVGTLAALVSVGVSALRARWATARKRLAWVGAFVAVYLGLVVVVSLITPQRIAAIPYERCLDDWCITVAGDQASAADAATLHTVTFHLWSRAGRAPQREWGWNAYLVDDKGRRFDAVPDAHAVPFDVLLQPRQV